MHCVQGSIFLQLSLKKKSAEVINIVKVVHSLFFNVIKINAVRKSYGNYNEMLLKQSWFDSQQLCKGIPVL